MNPKDWAEYDSAAVWCASRSVKGKEGDPLPPLLSASVFAEIGADPEAFQERVAGTAYACARGVKA